MLRYVSGVISILVCVFLVGCNVYAYAYTVLYEVEYKYRSEP